MAKNANHFFDYIETFINSADAGLKELVLESKNAFTHLHLKKNDFFVREGEICQYFCYIESGIDIDGEEKTTYLALRNSVTSSLNSFLFGKPSRKNIKAISDCELYVIDLPNFKKLVETNAAFHQFYYNLIEKQLCLIDDYRIDLLTLTPEERYLKLLSTEPKLLQEVPLHYLASFLGISSRHMSRIRKNVK